MLPTSSNCQSETDLSDAEILNFQRVPGFQKRKTDTVSKQYQIVPVCYQLLPTFSTTLRGHRMSYINIYILDGPRSFSMNNGKYFPKKITVVIDPASINFQPNGWGEPSRWLQDDSGGLAALFGVSNGWKCGNSWDLERANGLISFLLWF